MDDLRDEMRRYVLDALDQFAHNELPATTNAHGWKDRDLPELFKALDQHLETLLHR